MTAARKPRPAKASTTASPPKRSTTRRDRVPRHWPASLDLPLPDPDARPTRRRRRAA